MREMQTDLFAEKSKKWDMNSKRVKNAQGISGMIVKNIKLHKKMELMDFGAGTGLLSYFVAPYVGKIVAVDNSPSMLHEFKSKCTAFACETEVVEKDLTEGAMEREFDGIVSSMTIHHVEDISALFGIFHKMLKENGFIAIADLDQEDGSFHSDNTGVYHYGFDRRVLEAAARSAGFADIRFETASTIKKPHRDFTVFLMTARKE